MEHHKTFVAVWLQTNYIVLVKNELTDLTQLLNPKNHTHKLIVMLRFSNKDCCYVPSNAQIL